MSFFLRKATRFVLGPSDQREEKRLLRRRALSKKKMVNQDKSTNHK